MFVKILIKLTRLLKSFSIVLLFVALHLFSVHVSGREKAKEQNPALDQLILKARAQQTWRLPTWQALLHVTPKSLLSQELSRVDAAPFFLSRQGKQSSQAELEVTLALLLSEEVGINANQAVACRFPARRAWLLNVLEIEASVLPEHHCPHLNNWLGNLNADGLTLVFPVAVLNSPASMFGHTFLRVDSKSEEMTDLLAWTVNFSAHAEEGRGLSYAVNGVFGGYQGRFTMAPYHERVKAYSDIENRDIWEYELSYTRAEVHFILLHLWELLPNYFDYFFIDENCAYQLLALLDVARPNLRLSQHFAWGATPADTVRRVTRVPGLVTQVYYRPSLRQSIDKRAESLDLTEQEIAKSLALGELSLQATDFVNRSLQSQGEILELASDYLAYREANSAESQGLFSSIGGPRIPAKQRGEVLKRQHQLLTARSELALTLPIQDAVSPAYRPDEGHGSRRVGVRYGSEEAKDYLQLDFRWVYHDQYDPGDGFVKGAQLTFLQPSLRYSFHDNHWQFESIDFVNIASAPVRNYFIRPFSWRASASLERYRFARGDRPLIGDFALAAGVSYELSQQVSASVFIDTQLLVGDQFDHDVAVGLGASTELVYTLTHQWKTGLHVELMQYVEGVTQTGYEFGGKLRFSENTDSAFLFELTENREFARSFTKTQLSWQYYF